MRHSDAEGWFVECPYDQCVRLMSLCLVSLCPVSLCLVSLCLVSSCKLSLMLSVTYYKSYAEYSGAQKKLECLSLTNFSGYNVVHIRPAFTKLTWKTLQLFRNCVSNEEKRFNIYLRQIIIQKQIFIFNDTILSYYVFLRKSMNKLELEG